MNCPICSHASKVIETRGARRRRQCEHCAHRWTTREVPDRVAEVMERAAEALATMPREEAA